jgi:hypothetical protein
MAVERAQRFGSRTEAELARPRLKIDNPVPLNQFADLVGDYGFPKPEWIRCQLVDADGKCKKMHGSGWIVQLEDGSEGYIGHVCADEHFSADPRYAARFAAAKARVDREITVDRAMARLRRLLDDGTAGPRLQEARRRWGRINDRLSQVRSLLPRALLAKLTDRAKRRDPAVMITVIYVETEYDERTKKNKEVQKPENLRWGNLSGLDGLELRELSKIGRKLADADSALLNAIAALDQPITKMQKWTAALDYLERVNQDLDRREALLESFCRPESLKLLWLLTLSRLDQLAVVNAAMEVATRKRVSESEVISTHASLSKEITDAYDGRRFYPVG